MHQSIAARVGLKLVGMLLLGLALPDLAGNAAQIGHYWVYMRPQAVAAGGGGLGSAWWYWTIPMLGPVFQGVFGAVLYFRAGPIARRLAPTGVRLCRECGYDIKGVTGERCPECGAALQRSQSAGVPS
ncbi:MAG: hypothetical protein ACTS27_07495 [Phycisphaerales bacterium]